MKNLVVEDLVIEYVTDGYRLRAVDNLSFKAAAGEIVLLLGPSGSGKTSVLSALSGILTPTSGRVEFGETDVTKLRGQAMARYRRDQVGIVFQAFNLIPSATAVENVAAPLLAAGQRWTKARARAEEVLATVNMSDRAGHRPGKLSGGQQQRVALARALVHDPPLLIADEPTANLDYINAESIISLLRDLRSAGRLIVISTHDDRLTPIADHGVHMIPENRHANEGPQKVRYAKGEVIFEQGTRGHLVYVIEEGAVDILRVRDDAGTDLLATLGPPQYFGELGPMLGFPRSATALARTDVVLTACNVRDFRNRVPDVGVANPPAKRAPRKKTVKAAPKSPGKAASKSPRTPRKKSAATSTRSAGRAKRS